MIAKEKCTIPLLQQEAPLVVKIAITLFALVWLRQMFYLVPQLLNDFRQSPYVFQPHQVGTATLAFWLALNATSIIAMVYRKNWARIMQVLATLTKFLVIAWSLTYSNDFQPGVVYFTEVVAFFLLLRPSAARWFKKHNVSPR